MEIGNSKENLVLKTAGKLKVQWGNKFIDLLDNNGKLNFKHQTIVKSADSIDSINSNGIYVVDNNVIVKINDTIITLKQFNSEDTTSRIETLESWIQSFAEVIFGTSATLTSDIGDVKEQTSSQNNSLTKRLDSLESTIGKVEDQESILGRLDIIETKLESILSTNKN